MHIRDLLQMQYNFYALRVSCNATFALDHFATSLPDIDECLQQVSPCDASFVCRNTIGGFSCSCPRGTSEINGKCLKKKEFNGALRAPALNFTADLYDTNSQKYQQLVTDMSDAVCKKSLVN